MNIYIFTGPTLRSEEARKVLQATYLPPVSQGDVYRVSLTKPFAIGIIDGYFDRVPAVWHKEILWAMAQGIHVFGAASMGALRAAELDVFGMEGVGWIYEAFRDGILEDDDEVAVAHREDYTPLSDAMVNIRRTVEKAEAHGVVKSATGAALVSAGKDLFYPERTYRTLCAVARRQGLPRRELSEFERWLPEHRIDQKHNDALALLRAIRSKADGDHTAKETHYFFEPTYAWERMRHHAHASKIELASPLPISAEEVLEELRLDGDSYAKAADHCLLKLLLQERMGLPRENADLASHLETVLDFREAHNLLSPTDLASWLTAQQMTKNDFMELMQEEDKLRAARTAFAEQIEFTLPTHLRVTGQLNPLAKRAAHKRDVLAALGIPNPTPSDTGMDDDTLVEWYFRHRLGRSSVGSLASTAKRFGFAGQGDLIRAIRRERCYLRHVHGCDQGEASSSHVSNERNSL